MKSESRRDAIKKIGAAGVAGATVWTVPTIMSASAQTVGSNPLPPPTCAPCQTGPSYFFFPTATGTNSVEGQCEEHAINTLNVCRVTQTQKMVVSSDALGLTAPYFDETAAITVVSPTAVTKIWNVTNWELNCQDPSATVTIVTPAGPVDISGMFNGECGDFRISIAVRNAFSPWSYNDTYVVAL